jgi:hypothetical protein
VVATPQLEGMQVVDLKLRGLSTALPRLGPHFAGFGAGIPRLSECIEKIGSLKFVWNFS